MPPSRRRPRTRPAPQPVTPMFETDDLPLWSGTPLPAEDSPFVPAPRPEAPPMQAPLFPDEPPETPAP